MDRQALIDAAIAYARSNEDTPATKNLAELHARMAISLLTGEIGMYDPSFLTEDAEKVAFFDQVPSAPVVCDDEPAEVPVIAGVDGQVMLAAVKEVSDFRQHPEWIWWNARGEQSYGRWPKGSSLAPYVRADLAAAALIKAGAR